MKSRISVTIDKETERILEGIIKKGKYRNRSHAIEEIILEKLEEGKDDTSKR